MYKRRLPPIILTVLGFGLVVGIVSCSRESKSSDLRSTSSAGASNARDNRTHPDLEAKVLRGMVISIIDGDTIEILDEQKASYRIRLKGIDAPEKRQAFGNVSRENLAVISAGKSVTVEWQKYDRYGRIIGKVFVDGTDICLQQIKAGLAWHFKRFENEQTELDRQLYAEAEDEARSRKVGLWQESSQIEPWNFRRH